ncbi:hypothetical protein [Streptomyces sp. AcE210]|nr:hypothetical protein [Streptomyces sp. AcE210]
MADASRDPDVGIFLGLRANLPDRDRAAVDELTHHLGLTLA